MGGKGCRIALGVLVALCSAAHAADCRPQYARAIEQWAGLGAGTIAVTDIDVSLAQKECAEYIVHSSSPSISNNAQQFVLRAITDTKALPMIVRLHGQHLAHAKRTPAAFGCQPGEPATLMTGTNAMRISMKVVCLQRVRIGDLGRLRASGHRIYIGRLAANRLFQLEQ